jgi:signal transduction histidine kinase
MTGATVRTSVPPAAIRLGSGGDVTLSLSSDEESLRVSIADEGAGFPENSEAEVVRRFVSYSSGSSHTGLGLSVADAVVRAHGGKLEIHRSGRMTVVDVLLPRSRSASLAPVAD